MNKNLVYIIILVIAIGSIYFYKTKGSLKQVFSDVPTNNFPVSQPEWNINRTPENKETPIAPPKPEEPKKITPPQQPFPQPQPQPFPQQPFPQEVFPPFIMPGGG